MPSIADVSNRSITELVSLVGIFMTESTLLVDAGETL